MNIRVQTALVFFFFLTYTLLISYKGVEGGRSISIEEDDLDRQLKLPNKPAVKTIQTKHGEVYDCIDFYKQPAFDHPLLKNHKPQINYSSVPQKVGSSGIGLEGKGCPSGTVPIRRTSKEDLRRAKSFSAENIHPLSATSPGLHYAGVLVKSDPNIKYHGVEARMALYRPNVSPNQYSGALMWVRNGPENQFNHIKVGWIVNPNLYGDDRAHLFGHWTADGNHKTGCFDARCPGFVQVNRDFPIGGVLDRTSDYPGQQYEGLFSLSQKKDTGDWWLYVGEKYTGVGYWPHNLFTSMTGFNSEVGWRGEVYAPPNQPSPPMGSGELKRLSTVDTGYFSNIRVIKEDFNSADPEPSRTEKQIDNNQCYGIAYLGYVNDHFKHLVLYGGPGGEDCGV